MFGHRSFLPLSLAITMGLTAACGGAAPGPSPQDVQSGSAPGVSPTSELYIPPSPTATLDPAMVAGLPPARETQINLTAEAYNPEAIPEMARASYRQIQTTIDLKFEINGEYLEYDDVGDMGGAAVIVSDEPGFENHVYVSSAGHIVDPDAAGEAYLPLLGQQFGPYNVNFYELDLKSIRIGDVVLAKGQFGMTHVYDKVAQIDYMYLAIPKNRISADDLEKLTAGAVSTDDIAFDKITTDQIVQGVCEPVDANFNKVPTERAIYVGDYEHSILVDGWMTGGGCSGENPVVVEGNSVELLGINVANWPHDVGWEKTIQIYPYSDQGREGFFDKLQIAIDDSLIPR